jgi:hypothetical protein
MASQQAEFDSETREKVRKQRWADAQNTATLAGLKMSVACIAVLAAVHVGGQRYSPFYQSINVYIKRIVGSLAVAYSFAIESHMVGANLITAANIANADELALRDARATLTSRRQAMSRASGQVELAATAPAPARMQ